MSPSRTLEAGCLNMCWSRTGGRARRRRARGRKAAGRTVTRRVVRDEQRSQRNKKLSPTLLHCFETHRGRRFGGARSRTIRRHARDCVVRLVQWHAAYVGWNVDAQARSPLNGCEWLTTLVVIRRWLGTTSTVPSRVPSASPGPNLAWTAPVRSPPTRPSRSCGFPMLDQGSHGRPADDVLDLTRLEAAPDAHEQGAPRSGRATTSATPRAAPSPRWRPR